MGNPINFHESHFIIFSFSHFLAKETWVLTLKGVLPEKALLF